MTFVLAVTLSVLAYPYVFPPKRSRSLDDAAEELGQRLRRARDRVYEEIRALQQEYFLNNLSEDEYRAQLEQARHEAARLMREQQQVQQTLSEIEALVEEEMNGASKRASLDTAPDSAVK
jgi:Tfp pilus assembly protein FimT